MIKYTEIMLWYTMSIMYFDETPRGSSTLFFKLDFINDALYCCVRYSNIEYQDEIFKTYH